MGIFKRIADIISANINDLLDKCEDPEKMIKQVILEMEEAIEEAKAGVAKAIASQKRLEADLAQNQRLVSEWQQKAELSVDKGDDNLARKALARKNEYVRIVQDLEPQVGNAAKAVETLKANLRAVEAKLGEARRKRDVLIARKRAAEASKQIQTGVSSMGKSAKAFGKFERMEEKLKQMEAEAQATAELSGERVELETEFQRLDEEELIDAELQALKKKLGKGEK